MPNHSHLYTAAPLWRRFAALSYDGLLLLALSLGYGGMVTLLGVLVSEQIAEDYQPMFTGFWFPAGWVLTLVMFYCWFWRRSGQTLGMRTWRIQVVAPANSDQSPRWSQCFQRAFWGFLALLLGGAGYWYRFFDKDGDCLHDRLSRTRVVVLPPTEKPVKNQT